MESAFLAMEASFDLICSPQILQFRFSGGRVFAYFISHRAVCQVKLIENRQLFGILKYLSRILILQSELLEFFADFIDKSIKSEIFRKMDRKAKIKKLKEAGKKTLRTQRILR
ncbi:MAG: hypothetical protein J6A23_12325 [Thermoguttaceae bacterium]|nr:hypothetical protein [Thermoguttaceae bacterium]MBP3694995.1 hypothetical protein [Thermoguttaceae bacterium]